MSSPAARRAGKGIHDQAPSRWIPFPSAALRTGMTLSLMTPTFVIPGLVPGIHAFTALWFPRPGWP